MIFKRESTFKQILKKNETYIISESMDFPKIISFSADDILYCSKFTGGHYYSYSHIKTDKSLFDVLYFKFSEHNLLSISNKKSGDI